MSARPYPYRYAVSIVNYPAGSDPWAGTPIAWQPVADYLTPGGDIAAEDFNYVMQRATGVASDLIDLVGPGPAQNWLTVNATPTGSGSDVIGAACWDPFYKRWIVLTNATSKVWTCFDGGRTWLSLVSAGQPSTSAGAIAVKPSDGTLLALVSDGNTVHLTGTGYTYTEAFGGTWTSHSSAPSGASKSLVWFGAAGLFVSISTVNASPYVTIIATSPDGATWTDRTTGAGFTNAFARDAGSGLISPAIVAQSPTTLIAFSPVASFASYYSTADGITWTSHTSPVAAGEAIVGAAYDETSALFVLLVANGTAARCLVSGDGIHWTVSQASMPSPVVGVFDLAYSSLACSGSLYVAVTKSAGLGGPPTKAMFSLDKGVTWRTCLSYGLTSSSGSAALERVLCSGNQFIAWNGTYLNASAIDGLTPA